MMKLSWESSVGTALRVIVEIAWYVQILGFIMVLGEGIAAGMGVVRPISLPFPFEIDTEVYEVDVGELGGVAEILYPTGQLWIDEPARDVHLSFVAYSLLGMVIGLVVWYQLRKIVRTLADTRPFDHGNARRIRIVALALIIWQFVQAAGLGGWIFLRSNLVTEGVVVRPVPELDLWTLFAALVLLVLAEVFQQGIDLREDQQLTV